MKRFSIVHKTVYEYEEDVSLSHNEGRLLPRDFAAPGSPADSSVAALQQRCLSSVVRVTPAPAIQTERTDGFGNRVTYFAIEHPHRHIEIVAESHVELHPNPPRTDLSSRPWEELRARLRSDPELRTLVDLSLDSPLIPLSKKAREFALGAFTPGRSLLEACVDLMGRIFRGFRYAPNTTKIGTPPDEVLQLRRGVCQDFAHLFLAAVRSLGLPARYVSGYIETRPPPGKPRLQGADASHAWVSVFIPPHGWLDFDPTNDQMPTAQHITLAYGRDFSDATPLKGVIFGGGDHLVKVAVDVVPE